MQERGHFYVREELEMPGIDMEEASQAMKGSIHESAIDNLYNSSTPMSPHKMNLRYRQHGARGPPRYLFLALRAH